MSEEQSMTVSPADPAGKTPLVQSSVKADTPRDTVTDPPKPKPGDEPEDPYGLARELRAQAAAIEAAAPPTDKYVKLKVEPPHEGLEYGGTVLTGEFTPVHISKEAAIRQAAAAVGVTLTAEASD
jgi:hypothetical protein